MKEAIAKPIPVRTAILIVAGTILLALSAVALSFKGIAFPIEKSSPGLNHGDLVPGSVVLFFSDESSIDEVRAFVTDELMDRRGITAHNQGGEVYIWEKDLDQLFDSERRAGTTFTVDKRSGIVNLRTELFNTKNSLSRDKRTVTVTFIDVVLSTGTRDLLGITFKEGVGANERLQFVADHPNIIPFPGSFTIDDDATGFEDHADPENIELYLHSSLAEGVAYTEDLVERFRELTDDIVVRFSEGGTPDRPRFYIFLPTSFSRTDIAEIVSQTSIPENISWSGNFRLQLPVEIIEVNGLPEGTEEGFIEEMLQYPEIETAFQSSVVIPIPG